MKKFLMFPMLLMGVGAFAQVGINTTTPNAQLEVKSSNEATPANTDGIIIPKINAFPAVNPTAAQQGMMVYLTTTVGTRVPGFYYWDNITTTWIGVGSNTANAWGLTGNDGTTPGNNFMGTSDDKDLVFKRNNVLAGKLQINNTSYGLNSFFSNTTGSFNASHGVFSLFSNTTGQQNAGFGAYSLWSNTVGSNNAAFGTNAMLSNTSGICNTALGVAALYGNFTGNFNTAGGFASLLTNTTGNQNAGFGAHSLRLNTTGSNNAAFGTNAMLSNTSGNNNTALGAASLKGNTTGNFNTAGGFDSLFTNTVGVENTALGAASLYANTSGNYNTGIGSNAMNKNTTGQQNAGFGAYSLWSNTTGNYNTGIGTNAMLSNTTGIENSALGAASLYTNTSGNYNTGIGTKAMFSNTTGNQNAGFGAYSLTNNTLGSNNMGSGANALLLNTEGNDNAASGSAALYNNSIGSLNTATGSNSLFGNTSGSSNTASGYHALLSNSTGSFNSALGRSANVASGNLTNATAIGARSLVSADNALVLGSINGVNGATATVNVGIGTTTPLDRLHVAGNIRMVDGNQGAGKVLTSDSNGTATWTTTSTIASGTLDQAYNFGGAGAGRIITADSGAVTIAGRDGFVSSGGIGVGALAPTGGGTFMMWNPRKSSFRAGTLSLGGTNWNDVNLGIASVGFGFRSTASGNASASIGFDNTSSSFGEVALGIGATTYTPSVNGATQFRAANGADRLLVVGNAVDANNNDLVDVAERRDAMVILKNGNTGIGASIPQDKLHVVGNIRMVDGNQATGRVLTSDANGTATWTDAAANAWGLTGNVGTTAGTNFIGTTDDVDLVFKRNNILGGKLGNTNASFGLYSLFSNTTGNYNVAIGNSSMLSNTSGSSNLAIGWGSLNYNTTGAYNTAVGYQSLNISNADYNTAIGVSALYNTTTGANNTATGNQALRSNVVGANNTAVGYNSLFDSLGNDNTAVGYEALWTNTTGSKNTALGFRAAVSLNNLTNATAIGSGASVSTSNSLVLGSVNGVNGATSSVNVGIGTTSPSARLEVVDEDATTGGAVRGNLHVMTNSPQNVDVGAAITLGGYYINSSTADRIFGSVEGRKATNLTGTSSGYLMFKTNNGGTLTERMRITNTGNVGIGTATPGGLFELSLNEGRKPASNTWTITSDSRLKNVNGIYEKGLTEILQLKPIRYNYKNTEKRTFDPKVLDKEAYGFLAQEVQTIFPEAVGTDPDGYLNFDLHPILIASVNALKELNTQNNQLKNENETLRSAMQQMEQKVAFILSEIENLKK